MATLGVIWRVRGVRATPGGAGDVAGPYEILLAMDAASVVEVLPPLAWKTLPGVPEFVRGLFVHRGRLVPLVDSARLLKLEAAPDRVCNRVIVARMPARRSGTWSVGLWADAVLDLERVDFGEAMAHPGFATEASRFLGPATQTRFGTTQLVRPEGLFTAEQAEELGGRLEEVAA